MYDPNSNFYDIVIVAGAVLGAGYFIYRKLFKTGNPCGGGCDSCPGSVKKTSR
ncbi:FeoB-associated Cys-rich membrane protein [Vibrio sp. CAU 1672]|uniref:FeoB-associated Cys-rich membrane protein n=1 Tax=Vibrio sp. CAU 1672 TaxID=3032594 RepID=UPI0023DA0612|nr:FeoB-associated Cys-rich membrane protein [Vibrio sp. CAU 1672]MDF2154199.1 FeoB-associated Cys-rich membrane protein [Vibrio sp. CAU 1672]